MSGVTRSYSVHPEEVAQRPSRRVAIIATILSVALSLWAALKTSVINPDGICYLQSAAAMKHGLMYATHLCDQAKWPLYSMLIFAVTQFTHATPLIAAYTLNAIFSLITVLAFIKIVDALTTKKRIVWLALGVILLASEFNTLRSDIVRDHGFWAFYLLSLFFFLKIFHSHATCHYREGGNDTLRGNDIVYALMWGLTIIIASLFSIEGIMLLLLLPFVSLIDMRQTFSARIKRFLQLNIITIVGIVVLLCWSFFHPLSLSRFSEIQFQLQHGFTQLIDAFQQSAHALSTHVLNEYSARDAKIILVGMFISWYVINVASSVSLIYAVLIVYAWIKKLARLDVGARLTLIAYISVNVLITAIFLVDNLFITERYLIALSLVLMVWVPFAIDNLIMQWQSRKWPLLLTIFFILMYGLSGVVSFGYSKKYIREAGDWLMLNTSPSAKIYSNDYQVLYYANHLGNEIFSKGHAFENLKTIADGKWHQYDYLALRVGHNESSIFDGMPVAVFHNKRGDQVRIYRVKNGE